MPKKVQYRDGAVIYFRGENAGEKIYLLQNGKVILSYQDIETGESLSNSVRPGEFFGVKAALGRYPEEENAVVSRETTIMIFSVPEFEQLVSSNIRIIMKMLKIFSKELRRVHRKTANIMEKEGYDPENPEQGLFNVGVYYLKNNRLPQARYIFGRYLTYYPSGKNAAQAAGNLQILCSETAVKGSAAVSVVKQKSSIGQVAAEGDESATAKAYYDAVSFISQGKFQQAFTVLQKILDDAEDPGYVAKSSFEIGRCLFMLNKFDECIQHFTLMLTSYPRHPKLPDALFLMAQSYKNRGKKDMAEVFYKKILSMVPDGDNPINMKAKKALTTMRGA
ncbi:MAG: cyclic nucleotide-binding domain-containing protein [Treponema sp.]|jgi:TolA-binding protein|nr:cyclic nucleotide-binding domain-containing protein [Treponema sp.]